MIFRPEIGESLTLKFAEAATERRKQGKNIISLGLGEPDFNTPKELVAAVSDVLMTQKSGYSSPLGLMPLRERLAEQLNNLDNLPCTAGNVMVTAGAKQAMQFALMALLEPEDEVIVINPSFVSFIPQIYLAEPQAVVKIVDLNKSDFTLSKEDILKQVSTKTKVIIVNSPSNPTGSVFSQEEIKWIYNLANERDFYIISDEVYKRLSFSSEPILSIGSLESEVKKVFTINGYSKSHGITGWRFGFMSFPSEFSKKLLKLQQHINTNTCTFLQQAIIKAFDMDMSFLEDYNRSLKRRASLVKTSLEGTRMTLVLPNSGFFSFINISDFQIDSNTFCSELIKNTGVATTPGVAFGSNWDDHLRLSYAVSDDVLIKGLSLLKEFANEL